METCRSVMEEVCVSYIRVIKTICVNQVQVPIVVVVKEGRAPGPVSVANPGLVSAVGELATTFVPAKTIRLIC